ncbi:glycosyltransferase family 2 protein [Candidatus Methylospira mobilis]|uniref:Glycosyltransferase family 2 protein n=1 Tax=Candidatus Methylospira mobilis TaxID=1808979 RepID=A0A5Q0BJH6_9GAMM|nr:glycosyltransferase family 2 protein [Candidatus Methylospira mobilis]QFY43953.1 glycosyltransferase family 2 protein [Candidatus Methylospira mobilis]WNV04958.1 glycosyltransferase family 2 protein [Candidatus Methylospira mobilis]
MPSLSAILITKNEGHNLNDCLASLADIADEIIIVDSNSNDDTLAIAQRYGAIVSQPEDWPGFGTQKNRALDLATSEWVLSLDADERLTPELRIEIRHALAYANENTCFAIPRLSWYCGRYMKHSGWYPDYVARLFKRGTARFSDHLVHERLIAQGKAGKLRNALLHECFHTVEEVLDKINRYSSAGAEQRYQQGHRSSLTKAVFHGLWTFFRTYFIKAGFLDGREGFILAVSNAEGVYYRYLKLMYLEDPRYSARISATKSHTAN